MWLGGAAWIHFGRRMGVQGRGDLQGKADIQASGDILGKGGMPSKGNAQGRRDIPIRMTPEVAEALAAGEPVVALESSIIAQGMPHPTNVETALQVEAAIREAGAVPATTALLDGRIRVGLAPEEIERLGTDGNAVKVARRDVARALVTGAAG